MILDRLDGQPVTVTAEEFASDVQALLEITGGAGCARPLLPIRWGRADVLALSGRSGPLGDPQGR